MLATKELAEKCNFAACCEGENAQIKSIFCGDLLSWAMGRVPENAAWCTVMGNVNSVAVASLTDCACIVLCHGAAAMEDMTAKAKEQGINIFCTELPEFEAAVLINSFL